MPEQQRIHNLTAADKVSRREFIQLALALGMTASMGESLFAGSARAEPKKGGFCRLGFANGSTTDTLDPAFYIDTYTMSTFWGALSNSLTEVDPKGQLQGDLIEEMDQTHNAATWQFKLRKGLTFHDGRDVTAEDVVATLRHHMGPNSKSSANTIVSSIVDLTTDGKNAVVMKLKEGNVDFPYLLSHPALA